MHCDLGNGMADGERHATAWLDAIGTKSYSNAWQLLRHDQDVNVRGPGGMTALHVAAELGAVKKVQKLLADGADGSLTNARGKTPLRLAQYLAETEVVYVLIEHGELVRALTTRMGKTPTPNDLHSAMRNKKMRGFRDDVRRYVATQSRLLIDAARHGDLETVRLMVESGAITVDAVDKTTRETAFSAALACGRRRVCEYLLTKSAHALGACVINGSPQSVLVTAVQMGDVDFVRKLLAHGVRFVTPRFDGQTCALAEAAKGGSIKMVQELLTWKVSADFNNTGLELPWPTRHAFPAIDAREPASNNHTPWWLLAIACWQQDLQLITFLLTTQTALQDRVQMAIHGANALFLAVCRQNEVIVSALLARGASIDQRIDCGLTALIAAVAFDSAHLLGVLLDRGGDASVTHTSLMHATGRNESLLSTAVRAGSMACAHVLLPLETRPDQLDQALSYAAARDDAEFVGRLLDHVLPSTARALSDCVVRTKCPLVLELLLSRCCVEQYAISPHLNNAFRELCGQSNADLISVLLAHGLDIQKANDESIVSDPLLSNAISFNDGGGLDTVKLLLDSGVVVVSEDRLGHLPLRGVENLLKLNLAPASTAFLNGCRDLLLQAGHK